jgi:hypothetical protein
MDNNTENTVPEEQKKPDETSGFYFSSFLKITDPETKEVLVQQRGDL